MTKIFVTQNSVIRNSESIERVKLWFAKIDMTNHRVGKNRDEPQVKVWLADPQLLLEVNPISQRMVTSR